ncbi:glycoside hydrolase family 3 protein [Thermodesulfobacteriota bacterium B35]
MVNRRDIGRMFMVGFEGCTVGEDHWLVQALVRGEGPGGVILFDRNVDGSIQNIRDPGQLQDLTRTLQGYAGGSLLIAVDQEGGRVCRLKEEDGFPPTPSAAEMGRGEAAGTRRRAERMAATLAGVGINLNLAPVVDLDLNPDNPIIGRYERSFAADPATVTRHAAAFITAHHGHGIACCLKHFPGHGSGGADSHLGFVDVTSRWRRSELEPFAALIRLGLADAVMTAHVVQSDLDTRALPATLSPRIIRGLLRRQLGFAGVVISDDLQMRAISDRWGYGEAVAMAVRAGVDLLIVGNNLVRRQEALAEGITAIEELLASGGIRAEDIRGSVGRIKRLQQKITGKLPWKNVSPTA